MSFARKELSSFLIKSGVSVIIISAILILFVFGFTYGTAFIGLIGLIILFWGLLNKYSNEGRFKPQVMVIRKVGFVIFILWILSFLIVECLIFYSARSDDSENIDYILILGAGLQGDKISENLSYRLNKGLEYIDKNPNVGVVVSGGQGKGETISEAEAMKRYLIERGISEGRILKEDKSTSTYENVLFTQNMLTNIDDSKQHQVMIITSNYHLFRAKYLAREVGLSVCGVSSPTPVFILINYSIREYFAVIKSFIVDK